MYNLYVKAAQTDCELRTALSSVWYVDADEHYRVSRRLGLPGNVYTAVRTLQGEGELTTEDGRSFSLKANTLGLFSLSTITGYAARPCGWVFYWFEFEIVRGSLKLLNQTAEIPGVPQERAYMEHCCSGLRSRRSCEQFLAECLFNYLLADWQERASWPEGKQISARQLLSLLEKGRSERQSITALAQEAGMCERSFRDAVHSATGFSPKEYMEKMDMEAAMELLRTTSMSVADISDCLHYANPFYFSRVLKRHFGLSPLKARDRLL